MRKNRRDNKAKYLLILLLLIAVGYAAIATTLKINGSADVKSARWNVYWENPQVLSGSVTNTAPTLSESDTKATFNVTLNEPGNYYEFTIDAVNNGTLDAKIDTDGIVKQVKNASGEVVNPTILKYEVTNNDAGHTAIQEGHILAKKSGDNPTKETYRVRVEYRNDEGINPSDLDDSNDLVFTIEFSVKYVQGPKAHPIVQTWDTYYYINDYNEYETSVFDDSWNNWVQVNNSSSNKQVCAKYLDGSVLCLENEINGRYSDFEDVSDGGTYTAADIDTSGLKGYAKVKADEILTKDNSSCEIVGSSVQCAVSSDWVFYIDNNGYVDFRDSGGSGFSIEGNGNHWFHD